VSQHLASRASVTRRDILQGAAALGAATGIGVSAQPGPARVQDAARTLVIASPATPQGLDIEFDVSLGSIDALGALYDYMLAYEKIPDPKAPGVMREDIGMHGDRPNGLALRGRLAEKWEFSPDGLKAAFVLRQGVISNWGNTFSAADVKWTWDRKFNLKGQGIFQTAVLGLKTPDQIKVEADHVISFSLEKPNPLLLKQQCNLANPIYDSTKLKQAGGADDPWGVQFLKNDSAGFGPYRLSQIVRGQQAVFQAREDYWDEKPFMRTAPGIVVANPLREPGAQLRTGLEGMQVDALIFQAAPEPLDEHVVHPAPAPVHRDANACLLQNAGEPRRGELAALVGVENLRLAEARQCLL